MGKLILIDGNSLINRAFYATPPLSTKDGTPTNAVYGFMSMLVKLIGEYKPEHLLVAFDRKEPTFRHKIYAEYKGTRKPSPPDLPPQIQLLKELLPKIGIAVFDKAGIEADDIIGTMAKRHIEEAYILTGDRDSFQLVDEKTTVLFTRKGITDLDELNYSNFKEKVGVLPSQITDLKACMGDSSDNIPGIPGVGEKTALSLISEYGSLENVYLNVDKLKGKLKERVEQNQDLAFLSKKLATIDTEVDIPLSVEDLSFEFPFSLQAKKIFASLEFKNLIKRGDIFVQEAENFIAYTPTEEITVTQVKDVTTLEEFKDILSKTQKLTFFIGEDLFVYDYKDLEYCIKIKQNFFDQGLDFDVALKTLGEFLSNSSNLAVVYDLKSTKKYLKSFGVEFLSLADDVLLKKYLADFTGKDEKLFDVLEENGLNPKMPAYGLFVLDKKYTQVLKKDDTYSLYTDVELPLCHVLYEMEKEGFKVNISALEEMSAVYEGQVKNLLEKIKELAGENVNPNSPKQLGVLLFEKLGLKSGKKTRTGYSTSADVLEAIEDQHEIIPLILRYRQIQKLFSTYIEGFKPLIDRKTGLIHTCFNQALTTTGRLSSKEPNLQNIPVREEEGKEIRKLFMTRAEDRILLNAGYSQIELRLMAHFSKCQKLIDAFVQGKDVHTTTASQVFGVGIDQVTPQMRRHAKAVNFGIIYGISDFGLSKNIGSSVKKAGEYIKKYFEEYPEVKAYMDSNVEFARSNGYVKTILGRRRYIKEINSPNYNLRAFGERAAMNMPLQGTSADIIKIAMINVYNRLKRENLQSKLILQIHDELIIDAFVSEKTQVENILKEEMQNAVKLSVPLTVEVSSGKTWFDAK